MGTTLTPFPIGYSDGSLTTFLHNALPSDFRLSGAMLIAGCMIAHDAQIDGASLYILGGLSTFCIQVDRTLRFLQKYDVEIGSDRLFWVGIINSV